MQKKSLILALVASYIFSSFSMSASHYDSYSSPCNSSPIYQIRITPDLTNIALGLIGSWAVKLGFDALWTEWQRNENQTTENEAALETVAEHLKREHPAIYERLETLSKEKTKIGNNRWDLLLNGACFGSVVGLFLAAMANTKFFTVTSGYKLNSF